MARSVTELLLKISGDNREVVKSLKGIEGELKGFSGRVGSIMKGAVGFFAADKILDFGKAALSAAVDAEEAASAFATTFGPATQKVSGFVEEFANKAGFARHELQQLLATSGNVAQGLGATEQESAALATSMAQLAGDVASFSNAAGGAPAVLKALQSALTGEREALKTYGIVISEADVQTRAFQMTNKTTATELTRMEKALATVELAYERAGKAVGDLDRTQDSAANRQRELAAVFKEVQVAIGEALVPTLESLLPLLKATAEQGTHVATAIRGVSMVVDATVRVFGDGTPGMARFNESLRILREEFSHIEDPVRQATLLMSDFTRNGGFTNETLARTQQELGLTNDQMFEAVAALRSVSDESNTSSGALERLETAYRRFRPQVSELNDELKTGWRDAQQSFRDGINQISADLAASNEDFRLWQQELGSTLRDTVSLFDGAADEIDTSVAEMLTNISAQVRQNRDFEAALTELMRRGADDVVAELRAAGPGAARAAQQFLADPIALALAEANLGEVSQQEINDVMNVLARARGPVPAATATLAKDLGFRWDSSLQAWVDSTGRRVGEIIGQINKLDGKRTFSRHTHTIDVVVSDNSAGALALGGGSTNVFAFQHGGRHPANQPILVGERGPELLFPDTPGRVMNNHDTQRAMGGGVTIIVEGNLIHEREMIEIVERELARIGRRTGVL